MVTVWRENLTLDLLLWQAYGPDGQALLERALELNPGLAGLGINLPLGTLVQLPDRPSADPFTARPVVSLFG